jgi:hypothetical protein
MGSGHPANFAFSSLRLAASATGHLAKLPSSGMVAGDLDVTNRGRSGRFWCPAGMNNHASSRASERALFVLIVSPESCSRARWDVENKPWARGAGASRYAPLVSWA